MKKLLLGLILAIGTISNTYSIDISQADLVNKIMTSNLEEATDLIRQNDSTVNNSIDSFIDGTPLLAATFMDELLLVNLLLNNGADPNKPNSYGLTPLVVALSKQEPNIDLINLLLKRGANPEIAPSKNEIFLGIPVAQGVSAKALIMKSNNPEIKDLLSKTKL